MSPRAKLSLFVLLAQLSAVSPASGKPDIYSDTDSLLPPVQNWSGASESLMVETDDPWITPAERTQLSATPDYKETIDWLRGLVAVAPELEMVTIGKSLQGRDIWMVIASADRAFSAQAMKKSGKPLLLAHSGIHAGEIDGKDAGMMLLRDMTVADRRRELLAESSFLFIPILNVDGHERKSAFNRINQRGPVEMGWRTNARNQNLNRDFTKLDTEGVRALIGVFRQWEPDLYLDLHVTDGADYQYDITFGGNGRNGWSPAIGNWIEDIYRPAIGQALSENGHEPGGLIFAANGMDMKDGLLTWSGNPRFSNGYGDAAHLPTILVENHSLKPYKRRVLGTYVLLAETLELLGREADSLRKATQTDQQRRPKSIPLAFERDQTSPAQTVSFKGIASERFQGPVSGAEVVRWTGQAVTETIPEIFITQPTIMVELPAAYLVPSAWKDIVDRIAMHGIRVDEIKQPLSTTAEVYRLPDASIAKPSQWTPNPFEGHIRIDPGIPVKQVVETTFPAGSYLISTDQSLGELVVLMLEPQAPDSFLQWGFFLEIFSRTEYAEAYVLEPLAQRMLDSDAELKSRFEQKLASDEGFAASQQQRLMWFYEQTPFYDEQYLLYPVARIPRSN
ncbi:MAG: M14 family metallopeptidase [Xanthomonadales bacterium]|nr:M14 family metallopeptidase [Xanthomonadales bacterium]